MNRVSEKNLRQKNIEYWSNRVEGYSEVNLQELLGVQHENWLKVFRKCFEENFSYTPLAELKVLDVGTGPGFFPILLAELGCKVTAVDLAEEMLKKAQENAGLLANRIEYRQMDAQNLTFTDACFDVVVSRNLTWNLPEPIKAYGSWYRVLKPNGIMLNFDANWYNYLFNDEDKRRYERDRKRVAALGFEDHYLGTDINTMEEIAVQMPLSKIVRPKWDVEILQKIGFTNIIVDCSVGERTLSEVEKANYAATPIFMIQAQK